jgi:hypothetical protein
VIDLIYIYKLYKYQKNCSDQQDIEHCEKSDFLDLTRISVAKRGHEKSDFLKKSNFFAVQHHLDHYKIYKNQ